MWTSVVYRLKAPLYDKCEHKLDKAFTWNFDLKRPVSCLAMLGCHDLEGYTDAEGDAEATYDFNVTVSKHAKVEENENEDLSPVDSFQIRKNGGQKFYTLTGEELHVDA